MALSSSSPLVFECRSDPVGASSEQHGGHPRQPNPMATFLAPGGGMSSSLIFRFPPNFVRQLSIKARRNCSNIGVAQIVAAKWTDTFLRRSSLRAVEGDVAAPQKPNDNEPIANELTYDSFLKSDGSLGVHAGERLGKGIATDAITTPLVLTSAYLFEETQDLIDFKEKRAASFEYGRYGNPTTAVLEAKLSALEGAESTVVMASGMCASTVMLMALVPAGGHIVTTTDCYRRTRIFIQTILPKMGITSTVIDPADIQGLEKALKTHKVSIFFTESPTNPFLRCVDIKAFSDLCHKHGALMCVDGTFATPINQKALALGADLVLNSATKFIAGHNDVLAGCVSGPTAVIEEIRNLHHVIGGTLNPFAAYMIIRGMKTLHLRVKQQNATALNMAKLLEAHPKIRRVYYPGLPSHPEHHVAVKQMKGFGGVVSFEIDGDLEPTVRFADALKIPYIAPSFGGCESIVDQPAIMSYWDLPREGREEYGIKDNLIRFSFGIEDFEDLKNDILSALDVI